MVRFDRGSPFNTQWIDHIYQDPRVKDQNLILRYGDLSDPSNLVSLISAIQPDEVST